MIALSIFYSVPGAHNRLAGTDQLGDMWPAAASGGCCRFTFAGLLQSAYGQQTTDSGSTRGDELPLASKIVS